MPENRQLHEITDLLIDTAYQIVDYKGKVALGVPSEELPENYISFDDSSQNYIMDLVRPMLRTAQQIKKVQADSVKDVIKQLSKGKLTIDEATKLIELIGTKVEAEVMEDILT